MCLGEDACTRSCVLGLHNLRTELLCRLLFMDLLDRNFKVPADQHIAGASAAVPNASFLHDTQLHWLVAILQRGACWLPTQALSATRAISHGTACLCDRNLLCRSAIKCPYLMHLIRQRHASRNTTTAVYR